MPSLDPRDWDDTQAYCEWVESTLGWRVDSIQFHDNEKPRVRVRVVELKKSENQLPRPCPRSI